MARKKTNPHVGSDFEGFLTKEGRLEESTALSIKRVLAWEFDRAMKKAHVRKRSSRDG
jgi:antitoxin HicB